MKDLVLNKDLFGILGPYWVLIHISGSLFSLFWFHSRKECQFSLHVYNNGSGLNCWQILIFTYAYALIFIHRRFGSLFWLLGVLIGSLFHKKMGPYLKAWGSLLVLEAVYSESVTIPYSNHAAHLDETTTQAVSN